LGESNTPQAPDKCFEKARWWRRYNGFIRQCLLIRQAFYDFQFKIFPRHKGDKSKLDKWLATPFVAKAVRTYRRDVWSEWLTLDVAVGFWRDKGGLPQTYPPERCRYDDSFGSETLRIRHGLTAEQIRGLNLSKREKDELLKNPSELVLVRNALGQMEDSAFNFDVVKRERVGAGFGRPGLESVYRAAAQQESLEVRDAILAHATRLVIEQHLLGHEIKSGMHAGSKANFCNEKKAKAVEEGLRGKTGHTRIVTNFDHKVAFPGPDPNQYEGKRYLAVLDRLLLWSMPVGQIILTKTLNPYLMEVFRTQATADRESVGAHLELVFAGALACPVPIQAKWSDRCFRDSRLALDMIKTGLNSGPISQHTFITETGYDPDEEREKKAEEAKLPTAQTQPIYDGAHGANKKTSGPKPGSSNQTQ
jgi:hypothetical protein